MAKKFYAVKIGKTPGIYETWSECQKQISGYSGAVYKGFATKLVWFKRCYDWKYFWKCV